MTNRSAAGAWAVGVGALVALLYLAHVALYWTQINDDAFITFRYSLFWAEGRGPYFNGGERVEGYTNFLLMAGLVPVIRWLGADEALFAAKLTGVLGGAAAITLAAALVWRWLRDSDAPAPVVVVAAGAAAALTAGNSAFALNTTTGLETGLFAGLLTFGLYLLDSSRARRRWCGAGVAFALAALTRPEGAAVFALAGAVLLLTHLRQAFAWRVALIDGAIMVVVVAAHVAFRRVMYDGEWLPNTYYAKQGGYWGATTPYIYIVEFFVLHFAVAGAALALLAPFARQPHLRTAVLPGLAALALGCAEIYATGPDWMPGYRLLTPYAPILGACIVLGLFVIGEHIGLTPAARAASCVLLVAFALWWQFHARGVYAEVAATRARGYQRGHAALAEYLQRNAQAGDSVALMDIGLIGYRNPQLHILDVTGLTDRTIAKSPGGFLDKQYPSAYVFDRQPRFFVATFIADGGAYAAPIGGFRHLTTIEERLLSDPAFFQWYFTPRQAAPGAQPLEQLAAAMGATVVFEHDHPAMRYFLGVFERRATPASLPAVPSAEEAP